MEHERKKSFNSVIDNNHNKLNYQKIYFSTKSPSSRFFSLNRQHSLFSSIDTALDIKVC